MQKQSHRLLFNINKTQYICYIFLFMSLIYPLIMVPGPLPYSAGPRYIILAIVAMLSLIVLIREKLKIDRLPLYMTTIFLFFGLLSVLFSSDPLTAWGGSQTRFTGFSTHLFCVVLFLAASKVQHDSLFKIVKYMLICSAIVSAIAISQHYGFDPVPTNIISENFNSSYSTLGNPNFLGTYTVFMLPAAVMYYMYKKHYLWLVIAGLIFAALLTSLARASWIACFFVFLVIICYVVKHKTSFKRLTHLTLVFIAVYLILVVSGNGQLTDRAATIPDEISNVTQYTGSSASIRGFVWRESLKLISENWIFGVGPDNLRIFVPKGYYEDKAFNIFLEIAATMGVFALVAYLSIIGLSLKVKGDWTRTTFNLMIIAYIFQGQFNFDVISVMPLFWIVLGLKHTGANGELKTEVPENREDSDKKTEKFTGGSSKAFIYLSTFFVSLFIILVVLFFMVPRQGTIELEGQGTYTGKYRGIKTFHGEGELTLLNGTIYRGEFSHGLFHGLGTIYYVNGSSYIGEFKEGYFHGEGKFIFPDGRIQEGRWEKGIFVRH